MSSPEYGDGGGGDTKDLVGLYGNFNRKSEVAVEASGRFLAAGRRKEGQQPAAAVGGAAAKAEGRGGSEGFLRETEGNGSRQCSIGAAARGERDRERETV